MVFNAVLSFFPGKPGPSDTGGSQVQITSLSTRGIFMTPLSVTVVASVLFAAIAFGFFLDLVKVPVFRRLQVI